MLRSTVTSQNPETITLYLEHLDLFRFNGPQYKDGTLDYFRNKYRDKPIGVIVAIGSGALDYALTFRAALWPTVPVVFTAVDEQAAARKFPPGVTGITVHFTLAKMIEAARIVQPDLKRFAIVGTPLENQLYYSGFANELPDLSHDLEFINLMGLSVDAVKQRVAMLPDHTVILYIGINFFEKTTYVAAELVQPIAEAANRPVVVNAETFFGSGAVGGFIITPIQAGEDAGRVALRILAGEDAASIGIINGAAPKPIFDWRQLQRWDISENRLPSGSEIRFRQASFWEQYRWQVAAIATVIFLQAALITGLLYEHRRRRVAEAETRERMTELAHMNRQATAGELSASIAHELNQPLGAILANAETMEAILKSPSPNLEDVGTIINDIKRDDERASEVILRLRRLLKKAEFAAQDIEINQVVRESIQFLSVQAAERNVKLSSRLNPGVLRVSGDPIQLQQVILNLMTNAIELGDRRSQRKARDYQHHIAVG